MRILEVLSVQDDLIERRVRFNSGEEAISTTSQATHNLQFFKQELIDRGYLEKDINKLIELTRIECSN